MRGGTDFKYRIGGVGGRLIVESWKKEKEPQFSLHSKVLYP